MKILKFLQFFVSATFFSRSRSWSRLNAGLGLEKNWSRSWSRKKFCGIGLGLERFGLDFSPAAMSRRLCQTYLKYFCPRSTVLFAIRIVHEENNRVSVRIEKRFLCRVTVAFFCGDTVVLKVIFPILLLFTTTVFSLSV